MQELETMILPTIAFVLSGLTWALGGYIADWRANHNNPDWTGFELPKLRNDAILGGILGAGVVIYTIITSGDLMPILTAQEFLLKIGEGLAIVVIVDKFIVGGLRSSQ